MSKLSEYIGSQFGDPRGIVGRVCCFFMNRINQPMYMSVVSEIGERKCSRILDVGFGNGYLIERLRPVTRAVIYGIDISEDMKEAAESRNAHAVESGRVRLSVGDCCSLKFKDDSFDAVTSVNTVYFWEDPVKGLKEIRRVLKDGGVFYNAVYSKEWFDKAKSYTKKGFRIYEMEDFIRFGREAGFSDVVIEDIVDNRSYLVKFVK
ncbi:MAG: class I SAM-dependent methyltransferase [Oscillospiraceae bacterium]|nr:class I SAM-dependent methyltransferase [Oscillospiraceae bacterium]MDY2847023.1 class I SAM-dependent methyltransferase [Oscillospiraceae bacterium]